MKFFRLFAQSAVLGFAAYLYIQEMVSAGTIIACSILMGRILAQLIKYQIFFPFKKNMKNQKKLSIKFLIRPIRTLDIQFQI